MSKKNRHRHRGPQSESSSAGQDKRQEEGAAADAHVEGGEHSSDGDGGAESGESAAPEAVAEQVAAKAAPAAPAAPKAKPVEAVAPTVAVPAELEPLVERLRAGRCVLVAGNGLESLAGMPTWRQLLERLLERVGSGPEVDEARRMIERRPFVAAGFIRRRLGAGFVAALAEAAQLPGQLPEALQLLGQLPFRAIATTGYSNLLTRAFTRDGAAPPVFTPHDSAEIKSHGRRRYLLKLLGDPARAETVLWSAQEIQRALSSESFRGLVHDLYKHRSILFLGYAVEDLEDFFGRLFAGAQADETMHFAVLPGVSRLEADELAATFNIRAVDHQGAAGVIALLREAIGDFNADAPPDDDDLEGWLGVLTQEPDSATARDKLLALERRLRGGKDSERLIELHLGFIEVEPLAAERGRRLREVGKLFETEIGDLGKSFAVLLEAYKEDPIPEAGRELERLAAATGMWGDLLGEYTQAVPQLPEAARPGHWVHLAHLYGEKLGHADEALAALGEAIKLDPHLIEAQEMRIRLLRNAERWKDLAQALGARAIEERDAARRFEIFLEQADLFETRLHDGPAAAKAYEAALTVEPGNPEALSSLEQLHRRHSDFPALVSVIDQRIVAVSPEQARLLRKEAAAITADKVGDRKKAIERYEALRADGEADLDVLRSLEHLYDTEGRSDEYLEVLDSQAELVRDDKDRSALYRRLAAEWEDRPNGHARAAEYLEKLLIIDGKNEEALRAVERLYAADGKWEALVDAYRRHAELPTADRTALQVQIAQTYESQLGDVARASQAWNRVLDLFPGHEEGLAALSRLYLKTEEWAKALEVLDRRGEQSRVNADKVELFFQAGKLCVDRLADPKGAEIRFARAHGLDPSHVPSLVASVELYRHAGEYLRAAKLLVEGEQYTQNRLEKARFLVEAGELYAELDDKRNAAELYLKALVVDPEHVEAGTRVGELLWKMERWSDLVPVLEMLTRKEADKETQRLRWVRLGKAAKETNQLDKAARAYSKAAEIDPTDLETQRARGELLFNEARWLEARDAYAAVLHHHRDDLLPAELVDLFYRLGECDRKLDHIDKAKNFYAKALEIDPSHRPSILAQIDVGAGHPEEIIEAKRALLQTASPEESVKLLTEIGDLYGDKLKRPADAVAAYREAFQLRPDSRPIMHRCLDVYVQEKDWRQALGMLERLTEAEPVQTVRAKLKYARAAILRDELHEIEPAIALMNEAIDDDAAATPAFKDLEALLRQAESWKELQRYYRKAIKRMSAEIEVDTPEQRKERLRVWEQIASLSLDKLGERETGIAALEVLATLERGNLGRQEQLAQLYVDSGPTAADKAIQAHQGLLRVQHDRVASIRLLRQLYPQVRQPEKALACAYALSLLKKGDPEDQKAVAEAKQRPLQPVRRNLDDDVWSRSIVHPDEDRVLDALFAQLMPLLGVANGKQHKDVGLNRKDKLESTDPRSIAKAVRYVSAALDVRVPFDTYVRYEQREPLTVVTCVDKQQLVPSLIIGAPLLGDKRSERELLFELAKRLSHFRPERYLRYVFPQAAALGQIIDTATALAGEVGGDKPAVGEIGRRVQELKRALSPQTLDQVVFLGKKLKGQRGEQAALAWLAAGELTSTRSAFLLLGDLEQTARLVAAEAPTVSTHPATFRLKELIWYSVTEECFTARRHLGLMA